MSLKNLFIIGSCVTRDAIDPKFTQNKFKLTSYNARTSLTRLNYKNTHVLEKDIDLKSQFQRKVVAKALSGNLLDEIIQTDFDYLILDFVDDRFGMVQLNNEDIFVTYSEELRSSNFISRENKILISPDSFIYLKAWEDGLLKLLQVVPADKVIVNNVQWASETEDGDSLSNPTRINFCNSLVISFYCIASKYIPARNFINYDSNVFIGASDHKWGKSPFHYIDDVYHFFIKRLEKISSI